MKEVLVIITAVAFGLSCVTGYYLETDMRYGMMIMFGIGDMCAFVLLYRVFCRVFHMKKTACLRGVGEGKKGSCFFEKNTFVKVFTVVLLLWMPLVLIRFPGIQSGGVSAQFQQIMGMDTLARRLSPVIYDGHYISGHHPVLLTFLFGMFIKCGAAAGNVDIGMFLLNCAVCIFNALGWAYIISLFYQYLNRREWFLLFICFSANPLIISLNTYVLKDNLFATLLSVYCMVIFRIC